MIRLTLIALLVVHSSMLVAGQRKGKGGKGSSECRQKGSPCADGSHPTCPDGSSPDGGPTSDGSNSSSPTCQSGGEPLCQDGSAPQPPSRKLQRGGDDREKDDDCDEGVDVKMIVIVSVASSVALFCMCLVTYCWCRSIRNKSMMQKANVTQPTVCVASMHEATPGTIVVGQPVSTENSKMKAEDVV